LAFVFVFLCQNENKKQKQKKPKRENRKEIVLSLQEYLQHLQWVEACYALPCIKQPKGKSRTARAAHIFVDGVDLVRPGVASRLEVGDRGGLPKVLASRQRCAGLRAGAGQRCACQSACCVCHPHHDAVQAAQCRPAARGVRGCALGLVNVALANLPAVCVIRITCTMPCRPRSRRLGGRWMPNATGTTAKWRARQRQR
jgi:hypothetical protein